MILGGLLAVSLVIRLVLAARIQAPQILCDEFVYAELAESVADEGRLLLRGEPSRQSVLYPVLLAPAWLAGSVVDAYELAKALNVVLVHAGAVLVYLWARRLVSLPWALGAAALTLALPALHVTGLLMTENAFLPAFLAASFAIALSLERPTLARQALALGAVTAAVLVRSQGAALLAVLLAAVLLMAGFDAAAAGGRRVRAARNRLVAHWPTGAVALAAGAVWVIGRELRGDRFLSSFGAVSSVTTADYTYAETKRWALFHLAELTISVAVVPLGALIVLLALAAGGRLAPAERAFVAVTVPALVVMTVAVGAFASRFAGSIVGRYTFYLAPLLLLALVVWAARGAPRPAAGTALGVVLPVALVGSQSLQDFYALNLVPNTFSTFVFFRLGQELDGGAAVVADIVLAGAGAGAVALALLWRPLARLALPAAVLAFLLVASWPPFGVLEGQARNVRAAPGVSVEGPDWVDRAVGPGADATYLFDLEPGGDVWFASTVMLQVLFWNRGVDTVTSLGTAELCPLPQRAAALDPETGKLTIPGETPEYVVTDARAEVAGEQVAAQGPLTLTAVTAPATLAARWEGRYGDRWLGAQAGYTRYSAPASSATAVVTLFRPAWKDASPPAFDRRVRVDVGPARFDAATGGFVLADVAASQEVEVEFGGRQTVELPAPPPPFRVEIHPAATFVPAEHGVPDGRALSVQAAVEVRARGA